MNKQTVLIIRIVTAAVADALIGAYAYVSYMTSYCSDEIPDTDSIYVYAADCCFGELNRRYAESRRIDPADETRMITYDDIPAISSMEGVRELYIFDDAELNDISDRVYTDEITAFTAAVPADVLLYFGNCSGMGSMFRIDPHSMPDSSTGFAYINCEGFTCEWASSAENDPVILYYRYDPATWQDFLIRLDRYLTDYDAISDVNMLITCDGAHSADLQDELMARYPASNYQSRTFSKTWKDSYNAEWLRNLVIFSAIIIAVAVVIFVSTGRLTH